MARVRPPAGDSSKKFDPSPVEHLYVLLAVEHPYSEHLFPERTVARRLMGHGKTRWVVHGPTPSGADTSSRSTPPLG